MEWVTKETDSRGIKSVNIFLNRHVIVHFQSTIDKLIRKTNVSLVVGTSSWREQFVDAMSLSAGETAMNAPLTLMLRRKATD